MNINDITQAYLQDLDLATSKPGLEQLLELQSRHIAKYSFNNLAVILGKEIPLDTESVFQKIVQEGKGGYCFEHNKLVYEVLDHLGYNVALKMARVVYNQDVDAPRTHRISVLELDGDQYVVDVGFGHYCPKYPVKMEEGLAQDQGDATYRIAKNSMGDYCMQVIKDGDFFTLYTFDMNTYTDMDCLVGHFYSHKHPKAAFVNNLVICLKKTDEVLSLRNNEFHVLKNGETQITSVTSADELLGYINGTYQQDMDKSFAQYLFDKFCQKEA